MVGNFIFSNGKRIVVAIKQVKPFLYILYAYAVMRIVCTGMLAVVAGKQHSLVCLCGDVGFGKTEVAIRAAFKAVADNKQVTVLIKGTALGVVTDADGNYSLELPGAQGVRLIFSFIGMKTQEMAYTGQAELNIVMQEDITEMDEVVVTGYQNIKKEGIGRVWNEVCP